MYQVSIVGATTDEIYDDVVEMTREQFRKVLAAGKAAEAEQGTVTHFEIHRLTPFTYESWAREYAFVLDLQEGGRE